MVGSRVHFGAEQNGMAANVWRQVARISHIDEQAGTECRRGQGLFHVGLASTIFGAEYALIQPGTRRRAYVITRAATLTGMFASDSVFSVN
jgi:hypothetical protein